MTDLNLRPLPTTEEELEAQINEAFSPNDDMETQSTKCDNVESKSDYEYEYLPPDENLEAEYLDGVNAKINPALEGMGLKPLSEKEATRLASSAADVVTNLPISRIIPKGKTPLQDALIGLTIAAGIVAVPRLIDVFLVRRMVNVTPKPQAQESAATAAQEEELRGASPYGR